MPQQKPKFRVVVQRPEGVTWDLGGGSYDLERDALDPIGAQIEEVPAKTEEEFIAAAKDADALIARGRRITRNIIANLKNCKIIAVGAVGVDAVDVQAATDYNIPVTNVPDVFSEEVADNTMALLLAAGRRVTTMDKLVRTGHWSEGRPMFLNISRFMGQTIGFIAFGHIPRAVARRAKPFGFHLIAFDPYISEEVMAENGVEPVSTLNELLERSDYVSMHAAHRTETFHMLKEEHFRRMKKSAVFVNNGRGATVDEVALIKALREGWIAFAALDVLEKEPPDLENPLLHMDNVILTPHIASASSRMMPETRRRAAREIALALQGMWPRSAVNPEVLPKTKLTRWQPVSLERGPAR